VLACFVLGNLWLQSLKGRIKKNLTADSQGFIGNLLDPNALIFQIPKLLFYDPFLTLMKFQTTSIPHKSFNEVVTPGTKKYKIRNLKTRLSSIMTVTFTNVVVKCCN